MFIHLKAGFIACISMSIFVLAIPIDVNTLSTLLPHQFCFLQLHSLPTNLFSFNHYFSISAFWQTLPPLLRWNWAMTSSATDWSFPPSSLGASSCLEFPAISFKSTWSFCASQIPVLLAAEVVQLMAGKSVKPKTALRSWWSTASEGIQPLGWEVREFGKSVTVNDGSFHVRKCPNWETLQHNVQDTYVHEAMVNIGKYQQLGLESSDKAYFLRSQTGLFRHHLRPYCFAYPHWSEHGSE